ncbi:MAG: hypothetical protein MZV70_37960 [Desulfobacterales bacterium]|nr:hypothetical protein [Desulfobacterales bacterium]
MSTGRRLHRLLADPRRRPDQQRRRPPRPPRPRPRRGPDALRDRQGPGGGGGLRHPRGPAIQHGGGDPLQEARVRDPGNAEELLHEAGRGRPRHGPRPRSVVDADQGQAAGRGRRPGERAVPVRRRSPRYRPGGCGRGRPRGASPRSSSPCSAGIPGPRSCRRSRRPTAAAPNG